MFDTATIAPPAPAVLAARYGALGAEALVEALCHEAFPGTLAVLSSFGADSAVLLHMVARSAPDTPVLFLETGKHFEETLRYRRALAERLGLTNVVDLTPRPTQVQEEDPDGDLHARDPEACCALRKVRPLSDILGGFDAWMTGRRRHQTFTRTRLPVFESEGPRIKVNPLAGWDQAAVDDYARRLDLPPHPLAAEGFRSIGCAPCTTRTHAAEDARAGRWRGRAKTECGIHWATGSA